MVKLWTIHLPPGERLPFHRHECPYLYVAMAAGTSRSYHSDGSIHEAAFESGDSCRHDDLSPENPFIHNLENTDASNLIFSTLEFLR